MLYRSRSRYAFKRSDANIEVLILAGNRITTDFFTAATAWLCPSLNTLQTKKSKKEDVAIWCYTYFPEIFHLSFLSSEWEKQLPYLSEKKSALNSERPATGKTFHCASSRPSPASVIAGLVSWKMVISISRSIHSLTSVKPFRCSQNPSSIFPSTSPGRTSSPVLTFLNNCLYITFAPAQR